MTRPARPAPWTAVLAVALAMAAGLAGCNAPAGADGVADGAGGGPGDVAGAGAGGPAAPEPWSLPACAGMRLTLQQDRAAASEGMPEGRYASGQGPTAALLLQVDRCDALVVGNRSVVKPFDWAVVYHILNGTSGSVDQDTFWREALVSDAGVAAALAAFGFPARAASFAFASDAERQGLRIEAEGLLYEASWPAPVGGDAGPEASVDVGHALQGDRAPWARVARNDLSTASVSLPAAVTAQGGYLGPALAGAQAGLAETAAGSLAVTFGEGAAPKA